MTNYLNRSLLLLALILRGVLFAQENIALEDLWLRYAYFPSAPEEFRWMNDDHYYSLLESNAIIRYDIEKEAPVDTIVNLNRLALPEGIEADNVGEYHFSPNEKLVLIQANTQRIYRRSHREVCMVYDRASRKLQLIHEGKRISNATFSPDETKLAYVFENNLYYHDLATGRTLPITSDGVINSIINGATDWVYEEELEFTRAFQWSPDSRRIAFMRFDESLVPEYNMQTYGSLYPQLHTFKYPKAGEPNSVVTLHVFDLAAAKTINLDMGPEKDQYLARLTWADAKHVATLRLNRLQNQCDLLFSDPETGATEVVFQEKSDTYIEVSDDKWHFLEKSDDFLWRSEQDGYYHIYRYGRDGKLVKALTSGDFEVTKILGVDEAGDKVYFMSSEVSPMERRLYSVSLNGKKKELLTKEPGTHEVTLSAAYRYFVDSYSTISKPARTLLRDASGKVVKVLEENTRLSKKLAGLKIAEPTFIEVPVGDNVKLNGWMIKPADFSPDKKYPVLMYVYGGPGSQTVNNDYDPFNYIWFQMLAQKGYIVVSVDNRGTGARGRDFRTATYADLGHVEAEDQISAAKYLQTLSYVDAKRIGIWGWSYGGYMTGLCMTKGNGLFKAGISVAPVTNWRFYDSIYTERYLKTPQENPKGYDQNSPINFAKDLKGKYLLIHGTGDDNVHFQNSVEMVSALVAANKQFDLFFYPDKDHGIYGGNTRYHLFTKMTNFLLENL